MPPRPLSIGFIPADAPTSSDFDLVTAFGVVEHLDDGVGTLRALAGAARPDVIIVVTVPSMQMLWSDHDVSLPIGVSLIAVAPR